jgi:hypothetical protein
VTTLQRTERLRSDYLQLLASIFDFMRRSGIEGREVRRICAQALDCSRATLRWETKDASALSIAALTLDAWHRNRRYVDANAEPRAIPLLGKSPSVEALIRAERASGDPSSLARQLKALGLLVRSGRNRYKPAGRIALVKRPDPAIQQYIARSSATLLKTIQHNVTRGRRSSRLIERFAEVPDLPQSEAAEFRRFAQVHGWEFLRTLNDWLESRRARRMPNVNTRKVRAGVHLYAYVEPARNPTRRETQSS